MRDMLKGWVFMIAWFLILGVVSIVDIGDSAAPQNNVASVHAKKEQQK